MKERAVLLIGGNSTIGRAIATGIQLRGNIDKVINVIRTPSEIEAEFEVKVNSYTNLDIASIASRFDIKAIVIAFGVLNESGKFLEDLESNFQVNVIQYLEVFEKSLILQSENREMEIHITSSILADFDRDSIWAYSSSKAVMERSVNYLLRNNEVDLRKVFVWKLAFVESRLNRSRKKSIIFATVESIERRVSRMPHPGEYYVPKLAKYPSRFLRHFPYIARKLG